MKDTLIKKDINKTIGSILSSFKKLENFEELHDLNQIVEISDISKVFIDNLNSYYTKYVNSFLMSKDEVLNFIPVSEHDDFNVLLYISCADFVYADKHRMVSTKKKNIKGHTIYKDVKCTLSTRLTEAVNNRKNQQFIINTIDKIIVPVDWTNKPKRNGETFDNNLIFQIDKINKQLIVNVHYLEHTSYAVGGCWINGQARGYLSGETWHDYDLKCKQVHVFCTKTNRYIGRKKDVELEKRREWVKH